MMHHDTISISRSNEFNYGITAFKFGIWGGKSEVLRPEISFYNDASVEP